MKRHNRTVLHLHYAERELAKRKPGEPMHDYYAAKVAELRDKLGDAVPCKRCNELLRDPVSIARGLGPDCWKAVQEDERRKAAMA